MKNYAENVQFYCKTHELNSSRLILCLLRDKQASKFTSQSPSRPVQHRAIATKPWGRGSDYTQRVVDSYMKKLLTYKNMLFCLLPRVKK